MKKIYFFLLILFCSCDPGVDTDFIPTEQLFAVSSIISPQDTLLVAYLYRGMPLGSPTYIEQSLVLDAEVLIHDGSHADTLRYNEQNKRYEAPVRHLIIRENETYYLHVGVENTTLTAQCTIPPPPPSMELSGYFEEDNYFFTVTWENPIGLRYFSMYAESDGWYEAPSLNGFRLTRVNCRFFEDHLHFPADRILSNYTYQGIASNMGNADVQHLRIALENLDENIYRAIRDYYDYDEWSGNQSDNIIPNLTEPKPIFTNINGGVGVFSGKNSIIQEWVIE